MDDRRMGQRSPEHFQAGFDLGLERAAVVCDGIRQANYGRDAAWGVAGACATQIRALRTEQGRNHAEEEAQVSPADVERTGGPAPTGSEGHGGTRQDAQARVQPHAGAAQSDPRLASSDALLAVEHAVLTAETLDIARDDVKRIVESKLGSPEARTTNPLPQSVEAAWEQANNYIELWQEANRKIAVLEARMEQEKNYRDRVRQLESFVAKILMVYKLLPNDWVVADYVTRTSIAMTEPDGPRHCIPSLHELAGVSKS